MLPEQLEHLAISCWKCFCWRFKSFSQRKIYNLMISGIKMFGRFQQKWLDKQRIKAWDCGTDKNTVVKPSSPELWPPAVTNVTLKTEINSSHENWQSAAADMKLKEHVDLCSFRGSGVTPWDAGGRICPQDDPGERVKWRQRTGGGNKAVYCHRWGRL